MKVVFTKHAGEGLAFRGIREAQVKRAVERPDFEKEGRESTTVFYKFFGKKCLKIVSSKTEREIMVITCYWTSKERAKKEAMEK